MEDFDSSFGIRQLGHKLKKTIIKNRVKLKGIGVIYSREDYICAKCGKPFKMLMLFCP